MAKHLNEPAAIELVARNVRKYRQANNMSMETLADLIGIEYSVIARLELKKSNPSISLIYAIAKNLHIKVAQLFEE